MQTLEGLKLGTIKLQIFQFLELSMATYSDHIQVTPILRVVMTIQEFRNEPATDNEMAIQDNIVAMARSLTANFSG